MLLPILQAPSHASTHTRLGPSVVTTAYLECPQCGKRALSVATRCPHCGFNFPPRPLHRPAEVPPVGRPWTAITVGGAVAAIVLIALLARRTPNQSTQARGASPAHDSVSAVEPPPTPTPPPTHDTNPPPPTPAVPSPATSTSGIRRYAHTWVNVRSERNRSAPPVAVLNPGDSVLVDSLVRGWYRVLVDGRTVGYASRSLLEATPPE